MRKELQITQLAGNSTQAAWSEFTHRVHRAINSQKKPRPGLALRWIGAAGSTGMEVNGEPSARKGTAAPSAGNVHLHAKGTGTFLQALNSAAPWSFWHNQRS